MDKKVELKKLLRHSGYIFFWLSTSFSMAASNIIQYVLSLYVLEKTGSATLFATMLSIIVLPRIFFTPIAGVQGDRMCRLKMMKIIMFLSTLCLLCFSIGVTIYGTLPVVLIYVLVTLLEMIEVFYQAAESAIVPEIVPKDLLSEAVSLAKLDDGIVYVAAPAIGTVMYKSFGVQGGLWITTFFFCISFLLNYGIQTPYYKTPEKKEQRSFLTDFTAGLHIIKDHSFLSRFIFISPIMTFFFSSVFSVVVAYLFLVSFPIGEEWYGLYRSVTASMVIVVPFFVVPLAKKVETSKLVINSTLIVSIALFFIAALTKYVFMVGASTYVFFIIAITVLDCITIAVMMPVHISVATLYHNTIPDAYRSRVLSVSRMLTMIAVPLGNMFFGLLTDLFPPYINIAIAGAAIMGCWFLFKQAFKNLKLDNA